MDPTIQDNRVPSPAFLRIIIYRYIIARRSDHDHAEAKAEEIATRALVSAGVPSALPGGN